MQLTQKLSNSAIHNQIAKNASCLPLIPTLPTLLLPSAPSRPRRRHHVHAGARCQSRGCRLAGGRPHRAPSRSRSRRSARTAFLRKPAKWMSSEGYRHLLRSGWPRKELRRVLIINLMVADVRCTPRCRRDSGPYQRPAWARSGQARSFLERRRRRNTWPLRGARPSGMGPARSDRSASEVAAQPI
jgi:hypothetical protein